MRFRTARGVVPVDDDDWFAPNLADVLKREWVSERGVSWTGSWIGSTSVLEHRLHLIRRALAAAVDLFVFDLREQQLRSGQGAEKQAPARRSRRGLRVVRRPGPGSGEADRAAPERQQPDPRLADVAAAHAATRRARTERDCFAGCASTSGFTIGGRGGSASSGAVPTWR